MTAARKNLEIDQGSDWYIAFIYKDSSGTPINLTGYSSHMQLRAHYDDINPALSLSSGDGMTIDALAGKITVHATASQTGAIAKGDYFYDLEITSSGGIVTRLVDGRISVKPQVTR